MGLGGVTLATTVGGIGEAGITLVGCETRLAAGTLEAGANGAVGLATGFIALATTDAAGAGPVAGLNSGIFA
jgi:hypothetical protein